MKKYRNSQRTAKICFFFSFNWIFFTHSHTRIHTQTPRIIKYSGSCPCLCLVNNANRQADNIVITRCLFICLCLRTRSSFRLSLSRVRPSVSFIAAAFTAVRSRYFATSYWRLCVTDTTHLWTSRHTRPQVYPVLCEYTLHAHKCTRGS